MHTIFFIHLAINNPEYTLFDGIQTKTVYCVAENRNQAIELVSDGKPIIGDIHCTDYGSVTMPIGILSYDSYLER